MPNAISTKGRRVCPFFLYKLTLYLSVATDAKIDPLLESQFSAGRLYAAVASRPGQSGRADGYILEGKELEVGYPKLSNTR
jgi:ribosomal protein S8E